MKTIKEGKVSAPKPWWVGATIRCEKCGFVGTLEEGDNVFIPAPDMYTIPGKPRDYAACPTPRCNEMLGIPAQR